MTLIYFLSNTPCKKQVLDILSCHNFNQHINFPTRTCNNSSTLLDHAYSNICTDRVCGVPVITRLSDHTAQKITIVNKSPVECASIPKRIYNTHNKYSFYTALESIDWPEVVVNSRNDCVSLAVSLLNILINKFDTCFPIKLPNANVTKYPWIDEEVWNTKLLLHDISVLKEKFPSYNHISDMYNSINSKYISMLKRKRTDYYSALINNAPNKCKKMWGVINKELGRKCHERADYTDVIKDSRGLAFISKKHAVDAINAEFISAATACGAPAPNVQRSLSAIATNIPECDCSLRFRLFTSHEVESILKIHIAPKNSTDIYDISASILRYVGPALSFVLSELYNYCIRQGTVPDSLKKVKIAPLYKGKGAKTALKSYRPISLVPAISKILEVGINTRLLSFWFPQQTISDKQYAYRQNRSTTDLVREVVWRTLSSREAGLQVAVVCCDLSRAFDTANHGLIAQKLSHYGIRGPALALLLSFMSDRCQVVVGDSGRVKSVEMTNQLGVPQGSCLSNTLFSILLNDLPQVIKECSIFMYADDVTAVVTGTSLAQLETNVNNTLKQLCLSCLS